MVNGKAPHTRHRLVLQQCAAGTSLQVRAELVDEHCIFGGATASVDTLWVYTVQRDVRRAVEPCAQGRRMLPVHVHLRWEHT